MPVWSHPLPDTGPGTSPSQSSQSSSGSSSSPFVTTQDEDKKEQTTEFHETRPKRISGPTHRRRLPQPDVFAPAEEKKPKKPPKVNPFKSYEEYYKGKYAEQAYLRNGISPYERQAIEQWMNPEKSLLEGYGKGYYFQNARLEAYRPSVREKVESKLRSAYEKSFFGIVDKRLERTERELLGGYVLGQTSGKRVLLEGAVIGLAKPVLNPAGFLYDVAKAPVTLGKMAYERIKHGSHKPSSVAEKRFSRGAKLLGVGETVGSMIGATAIMPHVDYGLAKVRGYWRTRGLPEMKPEQVISRDVLTGKSRFANYPKSMLRADQTKKIQYLYSVNKPVKTAMKEATRSVDEGTKFLGMHATSTEFPSVTKVMPGSSEAPGLYMAPVTSPHFLRVTKPSEVSPYASVKGLFGKPLFMQKPTILAVQTRGIEKIPSALNKLMPTRVGDKLMTQFMWKQAGSGKTFISWRSAVGLKPEMEVIAAPESVLVRVSKGAYTTYKGIRVPIRVYKLLPGEALSQAAKSAARTVKASKYSSLGLETAPYGTYSLLGAASVATSIGSLTRSMHSFTSPKRSSGSSRTLKPKRSPRPSPLRRPGYSLPKPDVYYPTRSYPSGSTLTSGEKNYPENRPPRRPPYPPPRPPEPPRYPPERRRLYPQLGESPDIPPRPSGPRPPTSPPRRISLASTVTSIPRRTTPDYLLSAPSQPRVREKKRTVKKGKPKGKKAIKRGKWKRPVAYSHYLSGFGKAITMENLSGLR